MELSGNRLHLAIVGEALTKGVLVEGDFGRIVGVEAQGGALRIRMPAGGAGRKMPIDPETERRLRALGYIQ
jgi:formylmethanofuran dehydrogenase subunit C